MRAILSVLLLTFALAGCSATWSGGGDAAAPTADRSATPPPTVVSTLPPEAGTLAPQTPGAARGFEIWLLADPFVSAEQLLYTAQPLDLALLELADEPLLTTDDFEWYDWRDHSFLLTPAALARFAEQVPHPRTPFVVLVDGQRLYAGAFWAAYMSSTYPNPVIDIMESPHRIDRAYPGPDFAMPGEDPRVNPLIREAFRSAGKLVE